MPPLSKGKRRQGGKEIAAGRRFSLLHSVRFGGAKKSGKGMCFSAEKSVYPIGDSSPGKVLNCYQAARPLPRLHRVPTSGSHTTALGLQKAAGSMLGDQRLFFGHCFKPQKHISGNFRGVNV